MKFFSLLFIILISIFQNTTALKRTDSNNDVAHFHKGQNFKTFLASFHNSTTEEDSSILIGVSFNDISNHSINFVEFKDLEEACQNSNKNQKTSLLTSQKNVFYKNYRTLYKVYNNYPKNYNLFSPVSKQVLYQVFMI